MKFERNMSFSAEEFSDGEVLLYDDVSEVYHILNAADPQVSNGKAGAESKDKGALLKAFRMRTARTGTRKFHFGNPQVYANGQTDRTAAA